MVSSHRLSQQALQAIEIGRTIEKRCSFECLRESHVRIDPPASSVRSLGRPLEICARTNRVQGSLEPSLCSHPCTGHNSGLPPNLENHRVLSSPGTDHAITSRLFQKTPAKKSALPKMSDLLERIKRDVENIELPRMCSFRFREHYNKNAPLPSRLVHGWTKIRPTLCCVSAQDNARKMNPFHLENKIVVFHKISFSVSLLFACGFAFAECAARNGSVSFLACRIPDLCLKRTQGIIRFAQHKLQVQLENSKRQLVTRSY